MSTDIYHEFNPSPGYRSFIERVKSARLERGLSIADMSGAVGLTFSLAHEFETLTAPLPFEWLEVWCETVGVPFDDFLAIYWADERAWQEREDAKEAAQNAPCITSTEADVSKAPATETLAPEAPKRRSGVLTALRAAFDRITVFFPSRFSTP